MWDQYIRAKIGAANKVKSNQEDIYQEIASKLIKAQVLEKFVHKATQRLPNQVTAQEMVDFLGIPYKKLGYLHWKHDNQHRLGEKLISQGQVPIWVPTPISGGKYSDKALYSREDVLAFDALFEQENTGLYRSTGARARKHTDKKKVRPAAEAGAPVDSNTVSSESVAGNPSNPDVAFTFTETVRGVARERVMSFAPTGDGFKTYLKTAVNNHFLNFCRTKRRKEKEAFISPGASVSQDIGTGIVTAGSGLPDNESAWEESVADAKTSEDRIESGVTDFCILFRRACEEAGFHQESESARKVLDYMCLSGHGITHAFQTIARVTLSEDLDFAIRELSD